MNTQLSTPESNALARICNEWYVSFGALTVAVVLSFWIHPLWMPLYELLLAAVLALFGPGRKLSGARPCGRITLVTIYTLLATGLISFGINVAYHTEFVHLIFDISTLNHSIPYITSLVLFPVCAVISGVLNNKRVFSCHSRNCHLHNEYNPSQPMYGRIVHGTYRSLLKRQTVITAIISIIDWSYYFICYRNISINKPDSFFFFVIPAAIYVWSIIYVRSSYSALTLFNGRQIVAESSEPSRAHSVITDSSIVRYLVIHHDKLLLNVSEHSVKDCCIDTPVVEIKPHIYKGNIESAAEDFERISGVTQFDIKKLFTSEITGSNNKIFRFLITIRDDAGSGNLTGEWVSLEGIDRFLKMGVVSPRFSEEIFRIYTSVMAWKTYDRKGKRRYPIRNYRPTFRLEDMHKWDVDYDDRHWLKVSRINQDKRFWPLRRLFL